MSMTKAAREKIASRTIRAAKFDARDYRSLSQVTLNDRPTAAHLDTLATIKTMEVNRAKRIFK